MSTATTAAVKHPGLLRVHAWIVVLVTALTLVSALLALNNRTVEHTATAEVEVLPRASASGPATPPNMGTEQELATSGRVAAMAGAAMGLPAEKASAPLSVSVVTDTHVLEVSYTATDTETALRGADAFTRAYVDYRNLSQTTRAARTVTDPEVTGSDSGLLSTQVVIALSVVLGLCLGTAAAFLWDRASGRVRSQAELREVGLPVLGVLRAGDRRRTSGGSPPRKDVGHLAVRVAALVRERPGAMVVVTGTDGPLRISSVASELARALNLLSERAVLIDVEMAAIGSATGGAIVVVDAPALLDEPRAALIGEAADVVLVVTQVGRSRRSDVLEAAGLLQPVPGSPSRPARVVGWVACTPGFRAQPLPVEPIPTDGRHRGDGPPAVHLLDDHTDDLSTWEGRAARG